jgi:hypothetical protein
MAYSYGTHQNEINKGLNMSLNLLELLFSTPKKIERKKGTIRAKLTPWTRQQVDEDAVPYYTTKANKSSKG